MLQLKISPNSIQSHTQNSPKNKQTDRQTELYTIRGRVEHDRQTDSRRERDEDIERCSRDTGDKGETEKLELN